MVREGVGAIAFPAPQTDLPHLIQEFFDLFLRESPLFEEDLGQLSLLSYLPKSVLLGETLADLLFANPTCGLSDLRKRLVPLTASDSIDPRVRRHHDNCTAPLGPLALIVVQLSCGFVFGFVGPAPRISDHLMGATYPS